MHPRFRLFVPLLCLLLSCAAAPVRPAAPQVNAAPPIAWQEWSPETFAAAARDGRYLLVSVQAGWCHWCHVMNEETFEDLEVRQRIAEGFVAIKVDSDERPDLAERFRDYAWPATVLLTPEAEVAIALRGYQPAEVFSDLLRRVALGERPEPIENAPAENADQAALRLAGRTTLDGIFDAQAAGWGRRQKYPYFAPVEHAFFRATVLGETDWQPRALRTLAGTAMLIDPVFGGAYQYSLQARWDRPHYEKIAAVQADVIAGFATARTLTGQSRWDQATAAMLAYLQEFLTHPDGGFLTSQDADLSHAVTGTAYYAMTGSERRALGFPHVDTHVFVDLNGRLIDALVRAHRSGWRPVRGAGALEMATAAARRMQSAQRADGGLDHDAERSGTGVRYLRDQAWMLRAWIALYELTGDAGYQARAMRVADFVIAELASPAGFYAHTPDPAAVGVFAERRAPLVENGVLARSMLRLYRLTHEVRFDTAAINALRASEDAVRSAGRRAGDFLLALEERVAPYVMVSIVGPSEGPGSEMTHRLTQAALALPLLNVVVDTHEPGEGRYPFPGEPAAYMCSDDACSRPAFDPDVLLEQARAFLDG